MKKLALLILPLAIALVAFTAKPHSTTSTIDTSKSSVKWVGKKLTGSHNGTIGIKSGSATFTHGKLTGGEITIDMATITCLDLEGEYKGKLENHLKSADFFDVANHATSSLKLKTATTSDNKSYKITADLTIKGVTKEVSFDATVASDVTTNTIDASFEFDRTEFGVEYKGIGDNMVYDDVELTVHIVAVK